MFSWTALRKSKFFAGMEEKVEKRERSKEKRVRMVPMIEKEKGAAKNERTWDEKFPFVRLSAKIPKVIQVN